MVRFPRKLGGFMARIVKLPTTYPAINKAGFGSRWLRNIYESGFGRLIQVFDLKGGVKNVFLILLTFPTHLKLCRSAIWEYTELGPYVLSLEKSRIQVSFWEKLKTIAQFSWLRYTRITKTKKYGSIAQGADPPPPSSTRSEGGYHLKEEITPHLHTGIGERYCQNISNLGQATLLRRCELPL